MNMQRNENIPATAFFVVRLIAYRSLQFAVVALCWILFHSWPLLPGLLAKAFFDMLEGHAPAGLTLESIVALVVAAGLARIGIIYGATLSTWPWHFRVQGLLQRNLLARILERPGATAVPGSVGEAISTMRDDVDTMAVMADWGFDALAGLIFAGGGIAILLWVNVRVTLLVFLPILAVIALSHLARTRLKRAREQSREATAQVTGSIGEIFSAVLAIQVAGAEDSVIAHLRRLGDERQRAMLRDRLQGLALDAIFANTANLGAGLTLLVAASEMRSGQFTVGDFALFATYLMQVSECTGFLGYLINMYRQSGVAFRRAVALLQGAPAPSLVAHHPVYLKEPLPRLIPAVKQDGDRLDTLEVVGLTFRYPGSGRGIENVSFKLKRGSFTVITGRVGAGKTTLLRALMGLLETQDGEIYWNGRKIEHPASFLAPPRAAYTAQAPTLLSGMLERDLEMFPDGLETVIGARGVRLSGGQVQRTAAARMFVREPELLIFDDLSSALDVETEHILWQRVFAQGATCLVASHRRAVLARADQVIVLEDGHVAAQGKLKELLKQHILLIEAPIFEGL